MAIIWDCRKKKTTRDGSNVVLSHVFSQIFFDSQIIVGMFGTVTQQMVQGLSSRVRICLSGVCMVYLCLGGLVGHSELSISESGTGLVHLYMPPPSMEILYAKCDRPIDILWRSDLQPADCIPIERLSHGCINYVNAVTRNEEQQPGRLCVDAAGLLEFPSFRLFNLTAFICINHARNRATGVSSTSVHSKNSGRCPRPTYGHI